MNKTNSGTAYLLWLLCMFGICGGQRFYTGNIVGGIIYLCTFGIFGIGQLVDLVLIPGMVSRRNTYLRGLEYGQRIEQVAFTVENLGHAPMNTNSKETNAKPLSPLHILLKAAQDHDGALSFAQATMYTKLDPKEVKQLLHEAEKDGITEIGNDPTTGAIRYYFDV
ncbi:MAG: TM2 domain-containing protein [Cyanobacteria bacterium P01_F01_bin.150]